MTKKPDGNRPTKKRKSVEQKLFEAYQYNTGVRLSVDEVESLLLLDDAIRTRITNVAASEAGIDAPGADCIVERQTWAQFKRYLKRECGQ